MEVLTLMEQEVVRAQMMEVVGEVLRIAKKVVEVVAEHVVAKERRQVAEVVLIDRSLVHNLDIHHNLGIPHSHHHNILLLEVHMMMLEGVEELHHMIHLVHIARHHQMQVHMIHFLPKVPLHYH